SGRDRAVIGKGRLCHGMGARRETTARGCSCWLFSRGDGGCDEFGLSANRDGQGAAWDCLLVEWTETNVKHRMLIDGGPIGAYEALATRIAALSADEP